MSEELSIELGEYFEKFIKGEVDSGRYSSASDVLKSGLRLLEVEKKKIEAINRALEQGEQSGPFKEFDNEVFKLRMRKKLNISA